MSLVDGLFDLVFAPRCLGCGGAAGGHGALLCGRCRSRVVPPPSPLCARCGYPRLRTGRRPGPTCQECDDWPAGLRVARSAALLREPASRMVHELKYRGWTRVAGVMAEYMARIRLPRDVVEEAGVVVPVPTTPLRVRERGYNQAEVLARAFADRTRRSVLCALARQSAATSQTNLQPAARLANVASAFRVVEGGRAGIGGAHLLLVDDVLTTGATVTACTEALIDAGARCVSVITFARATGRLRLQ